MRMNTTLVINPKGGSGKTTVTTNLASYFAASSIPSAILDYDPQGSSLHWVRSRPSRAPSIHGANAAPAKVGRLRSIEMHVPPSIRQLIIDAPAGASGLLLQEMLARAQCILIPVQPSAIDIHASANFVKDLLLAGKVRARHVRVAVVANRVRSASPVYQPLERFLASLGLPFLARLSDSEAYLKAAETGMGIFEMDGAMSASARQEFMPIVAWVDNEQKPSARILEMTRPRWTASALRLG